MGTLKERMKDIFGEDRIARVKNQILSYGDVKKIGEMLKEEKDIALIDKSFFYTYLNNCKIEDYNYLFAVSNAKPTLYGSVYACMIQSLLQIENCEKEWCNFFNRYQRSDGIFFQENLNTPMYEEGEHWGARHLAAHIIIPYAKEKKTPPYEFEFLKTYRNEDAIIKMLEELDYRNVWRSSNKIMNIGVLLQYSRDFLGMDFYADTINTMEDWLMSHINKASGMWHDFPMRHKGDIYEAIRGAYHIYPLLLYDNKKIQFAEKIIDLILRSQNIWGGFDFVVQSGACADIDAIDLLIRMYAVSNYREDDVKTALKKAYRWIICNQGTGGGLMFSYNMQFQYGDCKYLKSNRMESNMLGTWFRLLCLLYIREVLFDEKWIFSKIPGYELCIERNGN